MLASSEPVNFNMISVKLATLQVNQSHLMKTNDLLFGSIAGMNAKLVEHPFDTIKVRLQTQPKSAFTGPLDCLFKTIKNEGVLGLYNGLSAPLLGSIIENALLFQCYTYFQSQIKFYGDRNDDFKLEVKDLVLSGFLSGCVVSTILTPIELVKCQLQVQLLDKSLKFATGPYEIIKQVYKSNGFKGFYSGHLGTLIRESFGCAIWFGVYEQSVCELLKYYGKKSKDELRPIELAGCGGMAGMTFNLIVFPADVIKSRQQTSTYGVSVFSIIKDVFKQGGFYRGLGVTLARGMPVSGTLFFTYETLTRYFK